MAAMMNVLWVVENRFVCTVESGVLGIFRSRNIDTVKMKVSGQEVGFGYS